MWPNRGNSRSSAREAQRDVTKSSSTYRICDRFAVPVLDSSSAPGLAILGLPTELPTQGQAYHPVRGVRLHKVRKGFACVLMIDGVDLSWIRMELRSISTVATPLKFSETCNMRIMYRVFFWLLAGSQM